MAQYLNFPFDPEIFRLLWAAADDPTKTALWTSGAVVNDNGIGTLISSGSDVYELPFYNVLGGTPVNYDGAVDITSDEVTGASQGGIVYGRAKAWKDRDFIHDYNSKANPTNAIATQVGKFWQKYRQTVLLKALGGVFGITGTAAWTDHTNKIASATKDTTEVNMFNPTTIGDTAQKAVGDNSSIFQLAVMHSRVAANLAAQQILEYRKYTDAMGMQRQSTIADLDGRTVIIDDGVPVKAAVAGTSAAEYTTYMLGIGSIGYAPAPVKNPAEVNREAKAAGGYDEIITRIRETIHPYGFKYTKPISGYTASPTDVQLGAAANWSIAGNPKSIALAQIITNG